MHFLTLWAFALTTQVAPVPELAVPPSPACVACRADLEGIRSGYSAKEWNTLTHGEILTADKEAAAEGSVQSNIEGSAIIPHPAAQVWDVITDFESRPRYIPDAKEMRIVRIEGNRVWLAEHLRFLLINIRYQVINTLDPELGTITWVLDKSAAHDIADTRGSWQIAPLPEGKQTLLRYRAWVDSGQPVPHFVESFLTRRSLPRLIDGVRSEVQRRFP